MAKNTGLISENLCTTGSKAPARKHTARDSGHRNPETRATGQENGGKSDALKHKGGHAVTMGDDVPSLERFQTIPNGKSPISHPRTDRLL